MKSSLRYLQHAVDESHRSRRADGFPTAGEVLAEIGLILAIHLAIALAVALTLRAAGIA